MNLDEAQIIEATLVIRGGTIYDGTGNPSFVADIAINGELIVAVGPNLLVRTGCEEIDARGKMVTPGWIDPHTHYDAQATWDPLLTPSAHCGVTTVIMGNCGVGFAPCQRALRPFLLNLMEAVEDIPGSALHEGIQWEWESFPEYLDALAKRRYACDVAVMIGHGGVRTWVMGKRANISDMPGGPEKNPVSDAEISLIAAVVREAVAAGALGFSTSRLLLHRDIRGVLTPGALAAKRELLQICAGVSEGGGGVFQMSADFASYDDIPYHKMDQAKRAAFFKSELSWMSEAMAKHSNLKVTFGMLAAGAPFFSSWAAKASRYPGQCVVQVQVRPQAFHMSHASGKNPFSESKTYRESYEAANGDLTQLLATLHTPSTRRSILDDMRRFKMRRGRAYSEEGVVLPEWMLSGELMWPWGVTYEPVESEMVAAVAKVQGRSALEVCYDLLLDVQGPHRGILWRPLFAYNGNNDDIVSALQLNNVMPGFDDAGAHCSILTDATAATSTVSYFGKHRVAGDGEKIPMEKIIQMQTSDPATVFGLHDRGVVRPGKRADLNVIDLDKLKVLAPTWANDLPTKAGRWVQSTSGYVATILRGVVTFRHDAHTGALPGRLVRNPASVGLREGHTAIKGIVVDESTDADNTDMSTYAADISLEGGASALARVMREDKRHRVGDGDGATGVQRARL